MDVQVNIRKEDGEAWVELYYQGERVSQGRIAFDSPFGGGHPVITSVYTHDKYQGKGLGTQVVKRLLVLAGEERCRRVCLFATYAGYCLYKKLGFYVDAQDLMDGFEVDEEEGTLNTSPKMWYDLA